MDVYHRLIRLLLPQTPGQVKLDVHDQGWNQEDYYEAVMIRLVGSDEPLDPGPADDIANKLVSRLGPAFRVTAIPGLNLVFVTSLDFHTDGDPHFPVSSQEIGSGCDRATTSLLPIYTSLRGIEYEFESFKDESFIFMDPQILVPSPDPHIYVFEAGKVGKLEYASEIKAWDGRVAVDADWKIWHLHFWDWTCGNFRKIFLGYAKYPVAPSTFQRDIAHLG